MSRKVVLLLIGFLFLGAFAMDDESAKNSKIVKEFKGLGYHIKETDRGVEIIFPEALLFDFDSDRLKPHAKAKMYQIAEVVNDSKVESRTIAVEGHTDTIGSHTYNMDLSKRRSQSVARTLVFSGVRNKRLVTKGFGDNKPISPNTGQDGTDNPKGRALNRRVELIIEYSRIDN